MSRRTIWWYLAMEYHTQPSVGHAMTSHARECGECEVIAGLVARYEGQPS